MVSHLQVLVACSDPESRQTLLRVLKQCGLEPVCSSTVQEARAILARAHMPLVVCEAGLPDGSFHDILRAVESSRTKTPVVVASRIDDTNEYLDAMGSGAFDFIARPYNRSEVERIVSRALPHVFVTAA